MAHIEISYAGVARSDTLDERVHSALEHSVGHMFDRVTRIEVHIKDDNGPDKHGQNDKRCVMEARPASSQPIAVEDTGSDLYEVVRGAAEKLGKVLSKKFEKADDTRR